jgi:hypothetical protein|tara:strand:+ start:17 stop:199 length:183 start_codon:yes stop_codon:yes gene_type:complete
MEMARQKFKMFDEDEDELYSDKKVRERDLSRKNKRKVKQALKTKDVGYLLEIEDEISENY